MYTGHVTKWQKRFLKLAKEVSTWSKDPSTKVGAVITNDLNQVLSLGYNGLPRGITDTLERLNNKEIKYKYVEHAERNAIHNAKCDLQGSSIFIYGLPPCTECTKAIIQHGIKKVYYTSKLDTKSKWYDEFLISEQMFKEVGIEIVYIEPQELQELENATI